MNMNRTVPVVLIRCADPRINKACIKLFNPDENPSIISNTGSIKYFLLQDRLAHLYEQIRFLSLRVGVRKIVLTNHTLCRFYEEHSQGKEAQLTDLRDLKEKLQKTFPELEVSSYYIDTETSESIPVE
jgi:hypothetical protein